MLTFVKFYWSLLQLFLFIGDVCCNPLSIGGLQKFIQQEIPDIYVKSLKIGNSIKEVISLRCFVTLVLLFVV